MIWNMLPGECSSVTLRRYEITAWVWFFSWNPPYYQAKLFLRLDRNVPDVNPIRKIDIGARVYRFSLPFSVGKLEYDLEWVMTPNRLALRIQFSPTNVLTIALFMLPFTKCQRTPYYCYDIVTIIWLRKRGFESETSSDAFSTSFKLELAKFIASAPLFAVYVEPSHCIDCLE